MGNKLAQHEMKLHEHGAEQIRDEGLEAIAARHLNLGTLKTRNMDDLDFKDQAVWCVKDALEAAYELGRRAGEQGAQ